MKTLAAVFTFMILASLAFAVPFDVYLQQGNKYLESGNFERAAKRFEEAVRANPQSFDAQKGLGLAYYGIGNNADAVNPAILQKSIAAFTDAINIKLDAESYYYIGMAQLALDRPEYAESVYNRLVELDKQNGADLAAKIAAYRKPESYRYLNNEHNWAEEQKQAQEEAIRKQIQEENWREAQKQAAIEAEREEKQRMINAIEEARRAAREAEHRASEAEAAAEKAKHRGFDEGHDEGRREGRDEGRREGHREGFDEGHDEGLREGRQGL